MAEKYEKTVYASSWSRMGLSELDSWVQYSNVQHCCCVNYSAALCLVLFLSEFMHKMLLFLSLYFFIFFNWTLAVLCTTPNTIPAHRKYSLASSIVHPDKALSVQVIWWRASTASSCSFFKEHILGNITMKISPLASQAGPAWGICAASVAVKLGFLRHTREVREHWDRQVGWGTCPRLPRKPVAEQRFEHPSVGCSLLLVVGPIYCVGRGWMKGTLACLLHQGIKLVTRPEKALGSTAVLQNQSRAACPSHESPAAQRYGGEDGSCSPGTSDTQQWQLVVGQDSEQAFPHPCPICSNGELGLTRKRFVLLFLFCFAFAFGFIAFDSKSAINKSLQRCLKYTGIVYSFYRKKKKKFSFSSDTSFP